MPPPAIPPFLERYRCNCGRSFPNLTGWQLHQAASDLTGDPHHRIVSRPPGSGDRTGGSYR